MHRVPAPLTAGSQPTIHVIATTFEGTRAALTAAVPLAKGSASKLVLIVPHIVPYAVELDAPCEPATFFVKHYTDVIERLGGNASVEICLCLCRRLRDVVM